MRGNPASTDFSAGLGSPQIYFLTRHSKSIERTRNSGSQEPFLPIASLQVATSRLLSEPAMPMR
jgi:hypothetical protein